ncbi:hypothetical protein QQS21_009075 [Conoideocrella luteorostrata]|uniref:Uncharacterized protein n=1 Tax=Conoideocrella luteorostrata TaxID=1105319 RepID=A0AAJ0FY49_9HYPO|nr:hypothetical protein QQS21_009075 [Conoideocrella luteorostrata]
MRAYQDLDPELVYIALFPTFSGVTTTLGDRNQVRQRVEECKKHRTAALLLQGWDMDAICTEAEGLLVDGVFAFTSTAEHRFPNLFAPQSAQLAHEQRIEAASNRRIKLALDAAVKAHQDALRSTRRATTKCPTSNTSSRHSELMSTLAEKLFPSCLPFDVQCFTMVKAAMLLREVCFNFAKRYAPDVLAAQGWTCAESPDLTSWADIFTLRRHDLPLDALDALAGHTLGELLLSLAAIPCVFTYSISINTRLQLKLLAHATVLARVLDGTAVTIDALDELYAHTAIAAEELTIQKRFVLHRAKGLLTRISDGPYDQINEALAKEVVDAVVEEDRQIASRARASFLMRSREI